MDDASVGAHSCAPLPADKTSPAPPAIADFACQISLGHKVSGVGTAHQQSQYRPGIVGWAVPTPQLTIPLFSLDFGLWTLDFGLFITPTASLLVSSHRSGTPGCLPRPCTLA